MIETEHIIYSVALKNNCPECYSTDGLELSFRQKEIENKWYVKVEKEVKGSIFCSKCKSDIFPVRWDEHIERIYNYYFKLMQPKESGTFFKSKFWIVISSIALSFIGVVVFLLITLT